MKPALSLGGYAVFAKYDDGVMLMGAVVVTEAELGNVTDALPAHGMRRLTQSATYRAMTFSAAHIVLTAALTGVVALMVGLWRLPLDDRRYRQFRILATPGALVVNVITI